MSDFHHKTGLSQASQLLFMFQCNEHVEMYKVLCSLACTWITIIDSQFGGAVVECLTRDRGAAGSSLIGVTALCSLSKKHLS